MKPLFEIGQKVVFVGKPNIKYGEGVPALAEGEIYKVSNPHIHNPHIHCDERIFIVLYEHPSFCYNQACFRPTDDTFGEWVEETVLKEAILEVHQLQNQ